MAKWDAKRGVYRCRRQVNKREFRASFRRKPDAEEWERNMERRAAGLAPLPRIVTLQETWDLYKIGLRDVLDVGGKVRGVHARSDRRRPRTPDARLRDPRLHPGGGC